MLNRQTQNLANLKMKMQMKKSSKEWKGKKDSKGLGKA
jgi:hypothetical protein